MTTPRTPAEHHLRGTDLMLAHAIEHERPVLIVYDAAGGERTTRIIEPYARETTLAGHQIVRAMDRRSGAPRTFRLDRIADAAVLPDERFVLDRPAPARIRAEIAGVDPDGWTRDAASWSPGDPIYP